MESSSDPRLLRLAAIVSGRIPLDSQTALTQMAETPDFWPRLIQLAQAHGLGSMLLWRVLQCGIPEDDHLWSNLVRERREIAVHFMLASRMQSRVQAALDARGIPSVWLKGIVLAPLVYPRPELRPMVDVDVMVPYAQRRAALATAESEGFRSLTPQLFDGREDLKHHYHLRDGASQAMQLEIHYRLLGPYDKLLPIKNLEWFWDNTQWVHINNGVFRALLPEAHVLYLAAHALLQHGEADFQMIRYYDLHRLIVSRSTFDWRLIVDQAVEFGWTYVLERALVLVQRYFCTPVPVWVFDELQSRRSASEDTRHAIRRQRRRSLTETVVDDMTAMRPSERMRTLRRVMFPPPTYMRWRFVLDHDWQLPLAYLWRWVRIGEDVAKTARRRIFPSR